MGMRGFLPYKILFFFSLTPHFFGASSVSQECLDITFLKIMYEIFWLILDDSYSEYFVVFSKRPSTCDLKR